VEEKRKCWDLRAWFYKRNSERLPSIWTRCGKVPIPLSPAALCVQSVIMSGMAAALVCNSGIPVYRGISSLFPLNYLRVHSTHHRVGKVSRSLAQRLATICISVFDCAFGQFLTFSPPLHRGFGHGGAFIGDRWLVAGR
jgi:hypothetical protein